ncbi:MAG: 6-hydroxymethylpterin diphosphokinase MptE-like protein [Rhodospirillaceae bacterium]
MEIDLDIAPAGDGQVPAKEPNLTDKWWLPAKNEAGRKELRERNMDIFRKKYPTVYANVQNFEAKSTLVFDENGNPDMVFAGTKFYDGDIEDFTIKQLAHYWRNPQRLTIAPPVPQSMDNHAGRCTLEFMDTMRETDGLDFSLGRSFKSSFYGIVMGIGLGRHIPEFVEKSECRNLFLLEPNYEGFYHSLELLDWAAVMFEFQDRNGDVFFYIGGTPQNWMDGLRSQTRATNCVSIDGINVYAHFNNPKFSEFSKKFSKESQFLMTGLGFFYDEQIMLRNTYDNMAGRNSRIYLRGGGKDMVQNIPAVIVGCGPSLDKNIEDIQRIADNAVIISCGSALGPLMDAGIRPDFQMELENIDVMRVMLYAAEKHDLSGICLVASSTVEREIKDFFDQVVYYFRPALCPFPIFSNNANNCLAHPDPTVVNVGLSFAQEMGFREYYFFGTDLGQKDSDQHHAKSSFHYSSKAKKNEVLQIFNIEVPGNFGGKAMTSSGLFWALDTIQRAILYSGGKCRYFNCSNGARIKGAIPKMSRTLDLPEPKTTRAEAVAAIVDSFPEMTSEDFDRLWQPERMVDAVDSMLDELVDIMETVDLVSSTDHMIELARLFYGTNDDVITKYAALCLRGSVNQVMIASDFYLTRVTDEAKFDEAMDIFRKVFREFADRLRLIAAKHIRAQALGLELSEDYLKGASEDDGLTDEDRARLLEPAS